MKRVLFTCKDQRLAYLDVLLPLWYCSSIGVWQRQWYNKEPQSKDLRHGEVITNCKLGTVKVVRKTNDLAIIVQASKEGTVGYPPTTRLTVNAGLLYFLEFEVDRTGKGLTLGSMTWTTILGSRLHRANDSVN